MKNIYFISREVDHVLSKYCATVHYTIAALSAGIAVFSDSPGTWVAMTAINLPMAVANGTRVDRINDEIAAENTLESKLGGQ